MYSVCNVSVTLKVLAHRSESDSLHNKNFKLNRSNYETTVAKFCPGSDPITKHVQSKSQQSNLWVTLFTVFFSRRVQERRTVSRIITTENKHYDFKVAKKWSCIIIKKSLVTLSTFCSPQRSRIFNFNMFYSLIRFRHRSRQAGTDMLPQIDTFHNFSFWS